VNRRGTRRERRHRFASRLQVPGRPTSAGDLPAALIATTIRATTIPAGLNYVNDAGTMIHNGLRVSSPDPTDGSASAFNLLYGASAWRAHHLIRPRSGYAVRSG
jgi:hypothetical protein